MGQRNSGYERKPSDFYATPAWVTEALLPHIPRIHGGVVWEPAAGDGAMAEVLRWRLTCDVIASDISPAIGHEKRIDEYDFLGDTPRYTAIDAVITNPPFGKDAGRFIERALEVTRPSRGFVAMLLRTQFDHGKGYQHLFGRHPAWATKLMLTRRIVWFVEANGKPKASPSDCHSWFIWDWRHRGPPTIAYGPDEIMEAAE